MQQQFSPEKLAEYVEQHFDSDVVPALMDFVRIDNLSRTYDPNWNTNGKLEKAAAHIQQWVQQLNLRDITCEIIKD